MKFLYLPSEGENREARLIPLDYVNRVVEVSSSRVPFAEGEFKYISVVEDECIPVSFENDNDSVKVEGYLIVVDIKGNKYGILSKSLPETFEMDEKEAETFCNNNDVRIIK